MVEPILTIYMVQSSKERERERERERKQVKHLLYKQGPD